MSVNDGYGPTVSSGVTAQAALAVPPVVVAVVVVVVVEDGPVGVSPPHASERAAPVRPNAPSASRRVNLFCFIDPPAESVMGKGGRAKTDS
jgi:hypothetical protein